MKAHLLINQDSGNTEHYTDIRIIEAAREVMDSIDTDPATSLIANERVKARHIYTIENSGLNDSAWWFGNVWMNHPFNREQNPQWIKKLIDQFDKNNCQQFCCITFAATSEAWFKPLHDFTQCYLSPRTNYYLPDGTIKKGVTKGSVVTYGGVNADRFCEVFSKFGAMKLPWKKK